jgi:heparan-alpha-glucosaminide N-acetyltransferase
MNAMLVFVLGAQGILAGFVNGWYYESPDNNLVSNNGWRLLTWHNKNIVSLFV